MTRSSAIEVLEQDYVRAARARGFGTMVIVRDQVLRAIGLPVITLLGLQAGFLLSSAVTVEFVFNWPGLGSLTASAIQNRDFTLIQALVA
ncbi:ABC transporter permease subunit, partial [Streptomyces brasiliscabiei]|uniref:ABC transporter permease subunit n=1 Tax=Streptomyces brasiliscabiei TaxID=2736302 RepID=UPI0038F65C6A